MIKELHRMAVFVEVVEHGSFSKAATALGLGKSIVSAHVAALEKRIGAQLLTRSTRALALTQEGSVFYENCRRMVSAGEDAFATVESHRASVSGTIRLTSSYNVGVSFLIAQLVRFRQAHPEVTFDLVLEDSVSHVIEERFDLAVRVGRLADTGLFATELGTCRMLLCASPAFLQTCPRIKKPDDLVKLPWITIMQLPHPEKLHSGAWADRTAAHAGPARHDQDALGHCGARVRSLRSGGRSAARLRRGPGHPARRPGPHPSHLERGPRSADFRGVPESRSVADSRAVADRFPEGVVE